MDELRRSELRQLLFAPRSVAIVGQSDDASKTAGRPLKYLRHAGYAGRVYPINPRRQTVLGERAWPSLAALPEAPEHVHIVTSTEAAMEAVAECGRLGVKIASVLADGFAEAGPEGAARVARLRDIARDTGLRIVGPSSLGVVDLRAKSMLTANASFEGMDMSAGGIFFASHSGTMIGSLLTRGAARGMRFAGLVSVGNEVDLSLGEICEATLDDPGIDGYLLFLETMRHAGALRRFALAAAQRSKPVLAYKLGRSAAARELAVSHTGALAGEDDVAGMFLAECGIARVMTLDGLIEGLSLLARVPLDAGVPASASIAARRSVGVLTLTSGGATMVVDPLGMRGIAVAAPSAATLARLAAVGIAVRPARLVDLTIAGARYDSMKAALDIMLSAPEFDLVLAVVGSSARSQPETTVRPIVDSAGASKPLAAFLVPEAPEALAALSAAGVPNFRTPEACADAIAAALSRRAPRAIVARKDIGAGRSASWPGLSRPSTPSFNQEKKDMDARAKPGQDGGESGLRDELQAGTLLDRLGVARAPSVALDTNITHAPALPFPYPVAVKVLAAEIAHKTDVGGVVLGVTDGGALIAAIRKICVSVAERRPDIRVDHVLVQPMVAGLGEVLVGYRVDRDVGPLVLIAAGGVLTEIARDRSIRLAPVDAATAQEMVAEVQGLRSLSGYRGRPKGDLKALTQVIVALSQLAHDPAAAEAEINPLIVQERGVVAVDALVRFA